MRDWYEAGAHLAKEGAEDYSVWSRMMLRFCGSDVEPHLAGIWEAVTPSKNSSVQSGPGKKRDYEKIRRNYQKFLEIAKLTDERAREDALNKLLDEAEGKTNSSSDTTSPQSATSNEEHRIEDLFTDVTHEREGWGYILPGPAKAPSSAGPTTEAPQIAPALAVSAPTGQNVARARLRQHLQRSCDLWFIAGLGLALFLLLTSWHASRANRFQQTHAYGVAFDTKTGQTCRVSSIPSTLNLPLCADLAKRWY